MPLHKQSYPRFVLHVFALSGFAFAQPVYEWIGRQPEFLTAHGVGLPDLLVLVFVLSVLLPLIVSAFFLLSRVVGPGAFTWVSALMIGALLALFGAQFFTSASPYLALVVGLLLWLAGGWLYLKSHYFQTLLSVLALAAVVFPLVFLFSDPVRTIVFPGQDELVQAADLHSEQQAGPIVVLMLDEFPLITLLDKEGRLDAERYPGFARLAESSDWYPGAATIHRATTWAAPALVSGQIPSPEPGMPDWRHHDPTLFKWASDVYGDAVVIRESATQLCLPYICADHDLWGGAALLLADVGILLAYVLFPAEVAVRYLPSIEGQWAHFGEEINGWAWQQEARGRDRTQDWQDFLEVLGNGFHYKHFFLPHAPLVYHADGTRYPDVLRQKGYNPNNNIPGHYRLNMQRHHAQAQYADRLLNRLIDQLENAGTWNDVLLLVFADHGHAYRPDTHHRMLERRNLADVVNIPFFVKRPGQTEGRIDHYPASLIDILPTIADIVGVPLTQQVDGVSLVDSYRPQRNRIPVSCGGWLGCQQEMRELSDDQSVVWLEVDEFDEARAMSLAWRNRHITYLPGSNFPVLKVPERHVLGRNVDEFEVSDHDAGRLRLFNSGRFDSVDPDRGVVPALLAGYLEGEGFAEGDTLVVGLNGRLVGVAPVAEILGENDETEGLMLASLLPLEAFEQGKNRPEVYRVRWSGGKAVALDPLTVE